MADYRKVLPATLQGMKRYLGSGLVKGIGPVNDGRIVDTFGEATSVVDRRFRTRFDISSSCSTHACTLEARGGELGDDLIEACVQLEILRPAGHMGLLEQHARFNEVVAQFTTACFPRTGGRAA